MVHGRVANRVVGYEVGVYARPRNWSLSVERRF